MNVPFQAAARNGVVIGTVVSLDDPLALNRVQVRLPYLGNQVAPWARMVTPMAGGGRGLVMRPEVGDEVLIVYEQGDPRRAYVVGALWSNLDQPPDAGPDPSANHWRFIRSRSGHLVKLDDTPGQERIEIEGKDGKSRLVIDTAGDSIALLAESGSITIEATAGTVTVNAPDAQVSVNAAQVSVDATDEVQIKATSINVKATADLAIEAGGMLSLKGSQIALN
ncbi:phage baseplate assembly protein V [Rhizobium leguminosarum]|uniref:phage baseplate assembly protein V n=1 Tax=Rhizobium leguminosarum TaxID=384 RepID=UPI00040A3100|nr:phage baseplate assembly protein V [Rhizobium leguminosarum]